MKTKFFVSLIALILFLGTFQQATLVSATTIPSPNKSDTIIVNDNGEFNTITTTEDKNSYFITVKSTEGTIHIERDKKEPEKIKVTSNDLTKEKLNEFKNQFFTTYDSINIDEVPIDFDEIALLKEEQAASNDFSPYAIKGSFSWSSYQNISISIEAKATVTVVTAAIAAQIPYLGTVAATLATVILIHNMKIGYFKFRVGTALDTNANYYWQKRQVLLYKESSRTTLLSNKTSDPVRFLLHN